MHARVLAAATATAGLAVGAAALSTSSAVADHPQLKHVLLISIDGLHQSDLDWYIAHDPGSELAKLARGGAEYPNAHTSDPSDSDPGGTALVTGGDPRATRVYYDVEYNHSLYEPGTTSCQGPTGGDVIYDSPDDLDSTRLDAGQGIPGLLSDPSKIMAMTGNPRPRDRLKPDRARRDSLPRWVSWTDDNAATRQYDSYKVQAIINEIDGYDHSGTSKVGVPAIFGMNFQTVSTAEKLLKSEAVIGGPVLLGGYLPGTTTPGPLLRSALGYIDGQLQRIDQEIQKQGIADQTAIIITAKHGQSPQDPNLLTRIKDGPIIDAINAAWTAANPGAGTRIVAGTDDDLWQSYLSGRSQTAADFVKNYLWNHPATGVTYRGGSRTLAHSGLAKIYAGEAVAHFFGVPASDPRHPDVFGRVQVGVVYTGGTKIAEHGGDNPGDRDVPIVVYAPGVVPPSRPHARVETTQVAPTILKLLGLDPDALRAVQMEGTRVLPGIGR